jgi:hypothetical protein
MHAQQEALTPDLKRSSDIVGWESHVKEGVRHFDAVNLELDELRRAMAAMERERDLLATRMFAYKQLVDLSAGVISHLGEKHRDMLNAPGHSHSRPGVWDVGNNPEKANQECKWCAMWPEFKSVVEMGRIMTDPDGRSWMRYVERCIRSLGESANQVDSKASTEPSRPLEECSQRLADANSAAAEVAFSTDFQPGFLEMRRIVTQATSITARVGEVKSLISIDETNIRGAVDALDEIDDFANTIVAMATILQPPGK